MGFRKLQCQPCGILNLSHDATQGVGATFKLEVWDSALSAITKAANMGILSGLLKKTKL